MIEEVKNLRVKIDGLAQLTKELKPIEGKEFPAELKQISKFLLESQEYDNKNSKEIEKAVDSLYLAKAWLGKVLGELNVDSPYKSGYKTKEDIEPTADVAIQVEEFPFCPDEWLKENKNKEGDVKLDHISHIEKVDWLRQEIKEIIDNTPDFSEEEEAIELEQGFVYKYLSEARFWLGFELQRIKKES